MDRTVIEEYKYYHYAALLNSKIALDQNDRCLISIPLLQEISNLKYRWTQQKLLIPIPQYSGSCLNTALRTAKQDEMQTTQQWEQKSVPNISQTHKLISQQ